MSPSEDERTACDNKYVQNCVSMASSCDQPLIVGLGVDCYSVKNREMFGTGCKAQAQELMKTVWDCDVPCIPGDCIFSQVSNHHDYTNWTDMWHADFLAKSDRDKDAALRYYPRDACDGDPSNNTMATLFLVNARLTSATDYAGFMGMDPRAVCALMTMPDMDHRARRLRRLANAESVRHIGNRFNGKMGEHYDVGAMMRVRTMTPDQRLAPAGANRI